LESMNSDRPIAADTSKTGPRPPVAWWHLHRRLYDWVLHWADTPYGTPALFVLAFAESSFFPVPPDVLLAPLVLGNRKRWFRFALACSLASVLGGTLGYIIGLTVWSHIDQTVYGWHVPGVTEANFQTASTWYEEYNFWIVFAAGFTPLPYKVITISAGVFFKDAGFGPFLIFLLASTTSRSGRFFLVAGLMAKAGPRIVPLLDKYFNWACGLFVVLLIGGFAVIKYLVH
jgi:membrane protein YqaA with SNARE-associated domain